MTSRTLAEPFKASLEDDGNALCAICMCDVTLEEQLSFNQWCSAGHEKGSSCHLSCMGNYIDSLVSSAFTGSAPLISCPCLHQQQKKKEEHSATSGQFVPDYPRRTFIINYASWRDYMQQHELHACLTRYQELAANLMPFLCSSCHTQSSIQQMYTSKPEILESVRKQIHALPCCHHSSFEVTLLAYLAGKISVNEFYSFLLKQCFGSPLKLAFNDFKLVLQLIEDPERRNNLHLRYLRDNRDFETVCCRAKHCWTCKTRPHPHISCEQNSASLDGEIIRCNTCGISLTKGDGCDSLKCVCGTHLNWSTEKRNMELCASFIAAYPQNTICTSAIYLFDVPVKALPQHQGATTEERSEFTSLLTAARAFRQKNEQAVNRVMMQLFANEFGDPRRVDTYGGELLTLASRFIQRKRHHQQQLQVSSNGEVAEGFNCSKESDKISELLGSEINFVNCDISKAFAQSALPHVLVAKKLSQIDQVQLRYGSVANADTSVISALGAESAAKLWFLHRKDDVSRQVDNITLARCDKLFTFAYLRRREASSKAGVESLPELTTAEVLKLELMQQQWQIAGTGRNGGNVYSGGEGDPFCLMRCEGVRMMVTSLVTRSRNMQASRNAIRDLKEDVERFKCNNFLRFFGGTKILHSEALSETAKSLLCPVRSQLYSLWCYTNKSLQSLPEHCIRDGALRWESTRRLRAEDNEEHVKTMLKTLATAEHTQFIQNLLLPVPSTPASRTTIYNTNTYFATGAYARWDTTTPFPLVSYPAESSAKATDGIAAASASAAAARAAAATWTWRDLWDSTMWLLFRIGSTDPTSKMTRKSIRMAEHFAEEFGASAPLVAALAVNEKGDNAIRALAYINMHGAEMNRWYLDDAQSDEPMLRTRSGCKCVPRHLHNQDCPGVPEEGRGTKPPGVSSRACSRFGPAAPLVVVLQQLTSNEEQDEAEEADGAHIPAAAQVPAQLLRVKSPLRAVFAAVCDDRKATLREHVQAQYGLGSENEVACSHGSRDDEDNVGTTNPSVSRDLWPSSPVDFDLRAPTLTSPRWLRLTASTSTGSFGQAVHTEPNVSTGLPPFQPQMIGSSSLLAPNYRDELLRAARRGGILPAVDSADSMHLAAIYAQQSSHASVLARIPGRANQRATQVAARRNTAPGPAFLAEIRARTSRPALALRLPSPLTMPLSSSPRNIFSPRAQLLPVLRSPMREQVASMTDLHAISSPGVLSRSASETFAPNCSAVWTAHTRGDQGGDMALEGEDTLAQDEFSSALMPPVAIASSSSASELSALAAIQRHASVSTLILRFETNSSAWRTINGDSNMAVGSEGREE